MILRAFGIQVECSIYTWLRRSSCMATCSTAQLKIMTLGGQTTSVAHGTNELPTAA